MSNAVGSLPEYPKKKAHKKQVKKRIIYIFITVVHENMAKGKNVGTDYFTELKITCDDTHAVRRTVPLSSSTGMPTVSINLLSSNLINNCSISSK